MEVCQSERLEDFLDLLCTCTKPIPCDENNENEICSFSLSTCTYKLQKLPARRKVSNQRQTWDFYGARHDQRTQDMGPQENRDWKSAVKVVLITLTRIVFPNTAIVQRLMQSIILRISWKKQAQIVWSWRRQGPTFQHLVPGPLGMAFISLPQGRQVGLFGRWKGRGWRAHKSQ